MTLPRQRGMTEQAADAAIDQACKVLGLPTVRAESRDAAARSAKDQLTYLGYLAELLLAECDDRARRRSDRRIKAASFPREKSLRTFQFEANPNIDPAVIHTLAKCEWVKKGQPLCLVGDSGTGKSHLLIALGTEAAMAGYRVRYTLATKLVNELVEAADDKQLAKTIARYGRVDLLCIDELGYMELDRRGAELLFQVLTEEKASVAIASNEAFGGWTKTFTGPRLCAAIVDRLTFGGNIIETGTGSYRFAQTRAATVSSDLDTHRRAHVTRALQACACDGTEVRRCRFARPGEEDRPNLLSRPPCAYLRPRGTVPASPRAGLKTLISRITRSRELVRSAGATHRPP